MGYKRIHFLDAWPERLDHNDDHVSSAASHCLHVKYYPHNDRG